VSDSRDDLFVAAEQNLADRIIAARRDKEDAYADRLAGEAAAAEAAVEAGAYTPPLFSST
jgi:hypothetical protein